MNDSRSILCLELWSDFIYRYWIVGLFSVLKYGVKFRIYRCRIVDLSSVQNYGKKFEIYRCRIVDQSSVQKYGVKFRILPHDFGRRIVNLSSVQKN